MSVLPLALVSSGAVNFCVQGFAPVFNSLGSRFSILFGILFFFFSIPGVIAVGILVLEKQPNCSSVMQLPCVSSALTDLP